MRTNGASLRLVLSSDSIKGFPVSPTILVVDDDVRFAAVVRRTLNRGGFQVLTVDDGSEVEEILSKIPIDALVLDLQMPGMNGFEVIRSLHGPLSRPGTRPKVIVLSGRSETETASFVTRLGADAFLRKPMGAEQLVQTLREVLAR